jgi:hypothetical protein
VVKILKNLRPEPRGRLSEVSMKSSKWTTCLREEDSLMSKKYNRSIPITTQLGHKQEIGVVTRRSKNSLLLDRTVPHNFKVEEFLPSRDNLNLWEPTFVSIMSLPAPPNSPFSNLSLQYQSLKKLQKWSTSQTKDSKKTKTRHLRKQFLNLHPRTAISNLTKMRWT